MGKFKYNEEEKDILRVLEMQKIELAEQEKEVAESSQSLDSLEERIRLLAKKKGVNLDLKSQSAKSQENTPLSEKDVPSWEELVQKANSTIDYQPEIEDFLTENEISYTLQEIQEIEDQFRKKCRLNKTDLAFLIIATALQTLRWVIINKLMGDIGEPIDPSTREDSHEGDKRKKKELNDYNKEQGDRENKKSEKGFPTWKDIIFGQYARTDGKGKSSFVCPYDAQADAPAGFDDGGRGAHRVNTLGHDPILGWIFGTANFMTCTISLSKKFNFQTYRVEYPGGRFGERTSMPTMFSEVYQSIREDKFRLPAAVFAQGAHLRSDVYTSKGLPVPILEVFTEEFSSDLYGEYYDSLCLLRDIKIVGTQAVTSIVINMLVSLIHGLFYNKEIDGERKLYEVRTRKVILYSNSLASAGNIAYAAATQDWGKLDVGGILVTITRLFSDVRFITRMKQEYLQKHLDIKLEEDLDKIESYYN